MSRSTRSDDQSFTIHTETEKRHGRSTSRPGSQKTCVCETICACEVSETSLLNPKGDERESRTCYGSAESHTAIDNEGPPKSSSFPDPLMNSIRCGCHVKVTDKTTRKARMKLIIACVVVMVFMLGEVAGGYFSSSLAILTDAAHMLSDFASFLISLFSIWMSTRPPSRRMSFGWHRAEVIGALVSVLIIWLVTGILCYEAVMRIIRNDTKIDADIMLITACVGVFVNVLMCMVLHQHDHGHGHGHSHGHSHGIVNNEERDVDSASEETSGQQRRQKGKKERRNINVRAAFIHVIGDLVQSVGVLIAGYIIKFWPQFHIVDPICTFLFSILVIFTTVNILRDAMLVIMEGVPRHINTEQVKSDLQAIPNVRHAHSIHVWSLTMSRTALAAHLAVDSHTQTQDVLVDASKMLEHKYGFAHTTLQVEKYQDEMKSCGPCQGTTHSQQARQRQTATYPF